MKFDISRAWKDKSYRQTLSQEDLDFLPNSPVGDVEMNDSELGIVFGGGGYGNGSGGGGSAGYPGGGGGYGSGCNSMVSEARTEHNESFAVICEINIYSVSVLGNIALLGN